ncbi:hypothetical protein FA13DRAFT_1717969 [Coprinellus micaceus]|uniref:Uncharacterized protein n=1 Tax=Coprinellus micaceus TaxID=71717 RepID=A0A4Y7SF36_COPMI|nr:hypothetical protein FA13DRAFT_1717969 [Coprinellus micaceus]
MCEGAFGVDSAREESINSRVMIDGTSALSDRSSSLDGGSDERDRLFHLDLLDLAGKREVATSTQLLRFKDDLPDYPGEFQFLEYRPLPFKLGRTSMGIKASPVALDQRPSYRGGVGYLEPESVEVLGGSVKSLEPAHMATLHRGFGARIIEELCLAKSLNIHPKGLYFIDLEDAEDEDEDDAP